MKKKKSVLNYDLGGVMHKKLFQESNSKQRKKKKGGGDLYDVLF